MSLMPTVETENAVVAGELGDGPELTLATARERFAVEGRQPSCAAIRRWIRQGLPVGGGRVRLAARASHVGLVTTDAAIAAFKAALELPRGSLYADLRQRARDEVVRGADLPGGVVASLARHGIAPPGHAEVAASDQETSAQITKTQPTSTDASGRTARRAGDSLDPRGVTPRGGSFSPGAQTRARNGGTDAH